MNAKVITTILVVAASVSSLYFIIQEQFNYAVLALTIMFTLSYAFRAYSFKEQGLVKESKIMRYLAIFFALATVMVIVVIVKG